MPATPLAPMPASAALAPPMPAPREAFAAVYRANVGTVWSWLRRMGVRREEREDLTQQTFAIACQRFEAFDPTRPARPWLLGIAFRVAVAARRTLEAKAEFVDEAHGTADEALGPEARLQQRQARELLWKGLSTLSVEQRAIFTLVELEGLSMPEAAEVLEVPLNTGYSRLRLARAALTAALQTMTSKEAVR
ncbi:MAG: sigma-70 family RNA polymerase sigma factor [Myxococcaceae bacterium]|nr:sigma-70 family RNA polymerase sigma factor [Myxococcaceae bacterium]